MFARNFSRQLRFHRAKILHFRHFAQRNENEPQKVVFFVCLFVIFIVSCVVRSPFMRGGLMSIVRIAALILIAGTIAAQEPPAQPAQPPAPVAAVLANYKPVTAERLKKPEDGDWLMVRRTYDGWGYSPLEQITTKNVEKLVPVWEFSTGVVSGHEAPPIVNNGVMFVATPSNQVIAIEARTGKILW